MRTSETALSSVGLGRVQCKGPTRDFTFIVGTRHYRCPSVTAEFLSPCVTQLRTIDATIDELSLGIADPNDLFSDCVRLARGEPIQPRSAAAADLRQICAFLRNRDLSDFFDRKSSPIPTICGAFEELSYHQQTFRDCLRDLNFIALHFFELNLTDDVSVSTLSEILASPSLRIRNEDWLYDYIVSRMESSPEFYALIEFVRCEYLSVPKLQSFIQLISNRELNSSVIRCIQTLLTLSRQSKYEFIPERFDPLNGIIAHLTREYRRNVHDAGVVHVASSPPISRESHCAAKNVADLNSHSVFCSGVRKATAAIPHTRNNWICYDFKTLRVIPTHYTIQSSHSSTFNKWNLKSWVVEVSINRKVWTEIDGRSDNRDLNDSGAMQISRWRNAKSADS
jgi:hypothetical protein